MDPEHKLEGRDSAAVFGRARSPEDQRGGGLVQSFTTVAGTDYVLSFDTNGLAFASMVRFLWRPLPTWRKPASVPPPRLAPWPSLRPAKRRDSSLTSFITGFTTGGISR